MHISPEIFAKQRTLRFGKANPERMHMEFWQWMLASQHQPHDAYKLFGAEPDRDKGPVWTFERMGATRTELADGRTICIGGEYEDFYDPDFCIYNDVVVLRASQEPEIYGYPKESLPPTDFHTAILLNDQLIISGGLGYHGSRRFGFTPVYSLDLHTYAISERPTSGTNPGWIFEHEAEISPTGSIEVRGGQLAEMHGDKEVHHGNLEEYALDIESWTWRRLTDRRWRQISISQEDGGLFSLKRRPKPEQIVPASCASETKSIEWNGAQFVVRGVSVVLTIGAHRIEVTIRGNLPKQTADQLIEEIRANTESFVKCRCFVEEH